MTLPLLNLAVSDMWYVMSGKWCWDPEHTNASSNGASQLNQQQSTTAQIIPLRSALLYKCLLFLETFPGIPFLSEANTFSCGRTHLCLLRALALAFAPSYHTVQVFFFLSWNISSTFTLGLVPQRLKMKKEKKKRVRKTKTESGEEEKRGGQDREGREKRRGKQRVEKGRMERNEGEGRVRRSWTLFSFSIHFLMSTRLPLPSLSPHLPLTRYGCPYSFGALHPLLEGVSQKPLAAGSESFSLESSSPAFLMRDVIYSLHHTSFSWE